MTRLPPLALAAIAAMLGATGAVTLWQIGLALDRRLDPDGILLGLILQRLGHGALAGLAIWLAWHFGRPNRRKGMLR